MKDIFEILHLYQFFPSEGFIGQNISCTIMEEKV